MSGQPDMDGLLRTWLDAAAPTGPPDGLLETTLARTSRRRPRPAWLAGLVGEALPRPHQPKRRPILTLALAGALLAIAAVVGLQLVTRWNVGITNPTPEASTSPTPGASPLPGIMPNAPAASPTDGKVAYGWPDTSENAAGVYSWDGHSCGRLPSAGDCAVGWMHNGYGSGDIEITVHVIPGRYYCPADGTAVTIAGHDAIYRPDHPLGESWRAEIEGTTICIILSATPGTSESDLAKAHAIISSMRTDPRDNDLGFRLVFELKTDGWDSG